MREDNGFDGIIYDVNGKQVCGGENAEGRIEPEVAKILVMALNQAWDKYIKEEFESGRMP